jgi:hypothetical protein
LFAAHSSREVAVGGADADFLFHEPAEGVGGAAEAGAAAAGEDFAACVLEDVFDAFFVGVFGDACTSVLPGTTLVGILTLFPLRMLAAKIMSVIFPPVQEPM